MEEQLYFVSKQIDRGAGTMEPGGWGRGYDRYHGEVPTGSLSQLIMELAIERVRLERHPTLPSRFNCNFLFTSEHAARNWMADRQSKDTPTVLWKAEVVDPSLPTHLGYFNIFPFPPNWNFRDVQRTAEHYWIPNQNLATQELLTASPVRLIERMDPTERPAVTADVPGEPCV